MFVAGSQFIRALSASVISSIVGGMNDYIGFTNTSIMGAYVLLFIIFAFTLRTHKVNLTGGYNVVQTD